MDRGTNTLSDEGNGAVGVNPHVFCLQGKTLAEAIAECKTARERLRLLPQFAALCDAIGEAHSRGIINRGLRPSIVLLSDYGETVVSDWTLSKTRGRPDPQRDKFAGIVDSAEMQPYLAPEISQGSVDEVDARSDVYALGVILHQLLTGDVPKSGASPAEQSDEINPDVPRELVQVCRRAMFREASARYANASQLADSVRQVEAQAEHAAPPEPAGVDPLYKTLLGTAVLCLVVLAGAFGFVYHGLSKDRAEAVKIRDKEIDLRKDAEEARDKLSGELRDADTIRTRVESDRDKFEEELTAARSELDRLRSKLSEAKGELITAHGAVKRAETLARLAGVPTATSEKAAPEKVQAKEEGAPEPFSTPLPDIDLMPQAAEAPAGAEPAPAENAGPAGAAAPALPALQAAPPAPAAPVAPEKPDLLKAMPDLIAALVTVEGAESKAAIRVTDATPPAVKAMRFRNGDYIITRINQRAIKTVDDAKSALTNVQNDTGFSIRVTRPDGLTTWMRINFTPPTEPAAAPPAKPEAAAAVPAAPPDAASEPPAEETEPASAAEAAPAEQ